MKRLLLSILICICALTAVAQEDIIFDKVNHNFGTIEENGGAVSHTFKYTNNGKEPFIIINIVTSCGCTTPSYSRAPLLKGESDEITVTFDPKDLPGRIAKEIRVISNQGTTLLFIDGNVNARPRSIKERFPFAIGGGARLDGLGMTWLQVPIGDTIIRTISVANESMSVPLTIDVNHELLPSNVTVLPFDKSVAANSITAVQFVIRGEEYGSFSSGVHFVVNGVPRAEKITLGGVVVDNFKGVDINQNARADFSTHYLSLGRVKRTESVQKTVTLKNSGNTTLYIRALEGTTNLKATANRVEIPVGESTEISIEFSAQSEGYANESARIVVNDRRGALREIRVTAEVVD